jgi:hypothetical protein
MGHSESGEERTQGLFQSKDDTDYM